MELQIIKTEGYVKGEICEQGSVLTTDNDILIKCVPNGQKTIIIPEGIKTVGRECFAETDVEEIVLPEGIEVIDTGAFAFCTKLRKINFPETLKIISHEAFRGCFSLETVILPKKMKELNSCAFFKAGIKHLTLPEKVSLETGVEIFAGIDIETIDIPENFTLTPTMFAGCQRLRSINLLGSRVTIPERCFRDCTSLAEIDITKAALIKDEAFRGCQNLSVSTIPADTFVAASAFEETGVTDVVIEDISKINNRVFADCKSLKKLTINVADGPTFVPSALVKGCENLQTVMFTGRTQNLTVIEAAAFKETEMLTTISLPEAVKTISKEAFYSSGIENIHLPKNLKQIGTMAFAGSGLKDIVIPKIKRLGKYAFYGCKELTEVTLPESVTKIPSGIFEGCCSLKTINAPNVDTVCEHAFYGCKNLEAFDFSKLQTLEHMAFAGTGIHEAIFSNRLVNLGPAIFSSCNNLQTVDMKACKIRKIPRQCFCFCDRLKNIQLPQNVINFDNSCFFRTEINKLTINAGTYVDDNAFGKSFINELVFADDTNCLTKTAVHPLAFENAEVGKLAIPDHMYDRFKEAIDKIQ